MKFKTSNQQKTMQKMRTQATDWEIFAKDTSDIELLSETKKLLKL